MARGRSRGHKGGRKQFSSADQIKDDLAKQEEKRRWREAHPDSESEESEEEAKPVRRGGGRRNQPVEEESSSSHTPIYILPTHLPVGFLLEQSDEKTRF